MNRELPYVNAFGTVDISSAKSVAEALELSALNWLVESKQIYDENGEPYDRFRANVRETDGKLLGVVTDKYHIIQNEDAFDFVNGLVAEGFKFDRAGQFRDGRSIWVMGSLPETQILGDDISNNVVFVNSHDGSSGVKVMMTPVRLICYNMMNLALRKANRIWATKHTGGIFTKLEEAKYTLGLANKYMEELNIEAERLANIKLSDAEIEAIFDIVFPIDRNKDSERKINNISIIKNNFIQCYNANDIAQFKGTAYGAINAMSDLVSHKVPARISQNFYENSWNNLINGHPDLDKFYNNIK
jgi:phage/plasmid-like protein (TIGR03299 family)